LIARKSSKEDVVSQPLWTQRRHLLLRRGPQRATQATLQRAQAQTPAETGHSSLRPQPAHHSMVPCTPQPWRCQTVFLKLVFFKLLVQTSAGDRACTQLFVRTAWCAKVQKTSVHINPREDALTQRSVECSKRFSGGMLQPLLSMKAVSSFIARCIFHWVSATSETQVWYCGMVIISGKDAPS
jgi:hypothetical protein